ncbi:hypothetical protein TNCV_1576881 [Trichonephila clavipes]|nr:hypothetical protein TNCV_1576881 [Trichonephila clavipes]
MVQRSREKEQKLLHINGTEKILLKGCTTIGIRNYDQKSSGRSFVVMPLHGIPARRGSFTLKDSPPLIHQRNLWRAVDKLCFQVVYHVHWPVESPDLSCMDLFFWSHMIFLVYKTPVP